MYVCMCVRSGDCGVFAGARAERSVVGTCRFESCRCAAELGACLGAPPGEIRTRKTTLSVILNVGFGFLYFGDEWSNRGSGSWSWPGRSSLALDNASPLRQADCL